MFDVIVMSDKGRNIDKIHCAGTRCTIGKSRDNQVQIKGWRISPQHAFIDQTDKGLFIEDISDSGATMVNGDRITRFGPLRSVDTIEIGNYEIKVGMGSGDSAESEAESPAKKEEVKIHRTDEAKEKPVVEESTSKENNLTEQQTKKEKKQDNAELMLSTMIGRVDRSLLEKMSETSVIRTRKKQASAMWRSRIHQEILKTMDLRRTDIGSMDEDELRESIKTLIDEVVEKFGDSLPEDIDREKLKTDVLNESVGLGPLEELLDDESVTEIMVNAFDDIYVEKGGKLSKTDVTFSSDEAVMSAIERIVTPLGRRIDESSPLVDARLKDGSRVNAIIPPLALKGPCLTIRKFSKEKLQAEDLLKFGSVNQPMIDLMRTIVEQHCNVVISGGTGSGKTTLLNIMSNFIPHEERVVTVEDAAELQLNQPHLVSLESRPPNVEGKGAIPIRELVKNCLRMRPDRIVVGECRGGEALDMLQAMNTGHDGSLTTAHANTPRDVIARLEVMVMMSGMELPVKAIREQVASAVHFIVQQTRFSDGSRRVTHISEVTGVEGDIVQLNDIFLYKQNGFDENGKVKGEFVATGQVPQLYHSLRERGIQVDMSIFGG